MLHNFKNIFMNSLMISLIVFGYYSFASLVPPRSTPISHSLNFFPLIFLKLTHSYWSCPCTLRSVAIWWSMLDLTGASSLKDTNSLFSRSWQLLKAPQLGWGFVPIATFHVGILSFTFDIHSYMWLPCCIQKAVTHHLWLLHSLTHLF